MSLTSHVALERCIKLFTKGDAGEMQGYVIRGITWFCFCKTAYVYLKGGFYIHVQLYSLHLPMKGRRMKRERYLFQFTSQVKCDSKRAAYYIDKL